MDSDTDRLVASLNVEEKNQKLQYLKPLNCRSTYKPNRLLNCQSLTYTYQFKCVLTND